MADLYHVKYVAYEVPQNNDFEFKGRAIAFADKMKECGFEHVRVFDEFDPREVHDKPDGSAEVVEKNPVYEP